MPFGQWMREQRIAQRRTQTDCAAAAGMKLQYWNRLEIHVGQPDMSTVRAVARALGVPEGIAAIAAGYASDTDPDTELARYLNLLGQPLPEPARAQFRRLVRRQAEVLAVELQTA
jgi:transcriptional regulator with XRE-family HTH domain